MPRLLVIGDVIDDIIVRPIGAIRPNTDTDAFIQKTLGGSAANVAAWAASLGAEVSFVGCVGRSDVERNTHDFSSYRVDAQLQSSERDTGAIVVLVSGQERSMLTDRGANQDLNLSSIRDEVPSDGIVYLSGYALLGKSHEDVSALVDHAHARGSLVAIDPGSTGYIEDYGVANYRELLMRADILFPNQEEAQLLDLIGQVPLTVVTDGPRGASAHWSDGRTVCRPGIEVRSVDPTGAGDAFCGAFLASLSNSKSMFPLSTDVVTQALEKGIDAGALAVTLVGARPALGHPRSV